MIEDENVVGPSSSSSAAKRARLMEEDDDYDHAPVDDFQCRTYKQTKRMVISTMPLLGVDGRGTTLRTSYLYLPIHTFDFWFGDPTAATPSTIPLLLNDASFKHFRIQSLKLKLSNFVVHDTMPYAQRTVVDSTVPVFIINDPDLNGDVDDICIAANHGNGTCTNDSIGPRATHMDVIHGNVVIKTKNEVFGRARDVVVVDANAPPIEFHLEFNRGVWMKREDAVIRKDRVKLLPLPASPSTGIAPVHIGVPRYIDENGESRYFSVQMVVEQCLEFVVSDSPNMRMVVKMHSVNIADGHSENIVFL